MGWFGIGGSKPDKRGEWREIVAQVRKEHPDWQLKDILKEAKRRRK
jgi:hypothetical protein